MLLPRRMLLRFLSFLASLLCKEGGPVNTLTYDPDIGKVFTPDDFDEPPRHCWGLTFGRPVDIREVATVLLEADFPLVQFRHVLGGGD